LRIQKIVSLNIYINKRMEAQKNTKKYWIICFTWTLILVALIIFKREFFWVALPGTFTYFAKAMDLF